MVIHSRAGPGQDRVELPLQLIQLLRRDPGEPSPYFENPISGIDLKQLQPKRLSTEGTQRFQSLGIAARKKCQNKHYMMRAIVLTQNHSPPCDRPLDSDEDDVIETHSC